MCKWHMQAAFLCPPPPRGVLTLAAVLLSIGAGCAPRHPPIAPPLDEAPMHVAIGRVNRNSAAMTFLLRAGSVVASGEYLDEGGQLHRFDVRGILLYRRPRDLFLRLEHLGGKIEAGSNDVEFWVWERFERERYRWGRHETTDTAAELDLPIRPDHLLDVLGLGNLPDDTTGPLGPAYWIGPESYELVFLRRDPTDQLYIGRTVDIDRREPFLVRSIVYFRPEGRPFMVARLSEYGQVEGSSVLVPRRIRIDWLEREGWLEMTFGTTERFDEPRAEKYFRSPLATGKVLPDEAERVDEPALPPVNPSPRPTSQPGSTAE